MEIMRKGKIKCDCGNEFYFQSVREEVPCMGCGRMHKNEGEPVPAEPCVEEESTEEQLEEELTEPENE